MRKIASKMLIQPLTVYEIKGFPSALIHYFEAGTIGLGRGGNNRHSGEVGGMEAALH